MDYRKRKYYLATFKPDCYDMRLKHIRNVAPSLKIHGPYNHAKDCQTFCMSKKYDGETIGINTKDDKIKHMKYWQMMISCKIEEAEALEYELRKATREDVGFWYNSSFYMEINKDICGQ